MKRKLKRLSMLIDLVALLRTLCSTSSTSLMLPSQAPSSDSDCFYTSSLVYTKNMILIWLAMKNQLQHHLKDSSVALRLPSRTLYEATTTKASDKDPFLFELVRVLLHALLGETVKITKFLN